MVYDRPPIQDKSDQKTVLMEWFDVLSSVENPFLCGVNYLFVSMTLLELIGLKLMFYLYIYICGQLFPLL